MFNYYQSLRNILRPLYYWFYFRYILILEFIFPPKTKDFYKIPIIINNFNRLTYLKALIEALESRGYYNIFIIDNASSYPQLLDYYKNCKYKIYYLSENLGHLALWESNLFQYFKKDYYVYTDPDVVPVLECPSDFMRHFVGCLKKFKFARKVGFSLRIDNIPDHYKFKNEVIKWEGQYYNLEINDHLYRAPIDTTFALYRPRVKGGSNSYVPMYRTKFPYQAEHLPWYVDSNNLTEEEIFYISNSKTSTMWTQEHSKGDI